MKTQQKLGALCAAFALSSTAAQALNVLHIASADSADYSAFITGRGDTWTHKLGGTTGNDTVGGDLDRTATFTGTITSGTMTVRAYLQSFDLIIVGNGNNSANFNDLNAGLDWAAISKPILVHAGLVARTSSTAGTVVDRFGLFSAGSGTYTYGNPTDTALTNPTSTLSTAIFEGVADPTNLYADVAAASTESVPFTNTFGSGQSISSLVSTPSGHGIAFWQVGATGGGNLQFQGKRAFMALKNAPNSSSALTVDGKIVLGNIIDELLAVSEQVFFPPTGLTAKSVTGNGINLTWIASEGAVSYNVKRSQTGGPPYTTISTSGIVTTNSFSDTGLTNGTTYTYVVSAVNSTPTESADSGAATATSVTTVLPGINILFVSNANDAAYQSFATNGQFANNTWTQKATGTANADTVGGDLYRTATYTGLFAGSQTNLEYLEKFDLIIIGTPTTSLSFVDGTYGGNWASITKPIIVHPNTVARSSAGRLGLFSQDNFLTFTTGTLVDSVRMSHTALSDKLFAGVSSESDLYTSTINDVVNGIALYGNGELITSASDGTAKHFGLVFWAEGDVIGGGPLLSGNRAFLPLKVTFNDLNANGKVLLANLIKEIQLPQTTAANPYAEWAATTISALEINAAPTFDADIDNDGLYNGLEWILGGNPLVNDGVSKMPVSAGNGTNGLTLVFSRDSSVTSTSTLQVVWGTDLAAMDNIINIGTSDVGPNGILPTVDIDSPPGSISVNIPAANAAGGKLFARLKGQPIR